MRFPLSSLLLVLVVAPMTAQRPVWPDEGPAKWAPRPTVQAITPNDLRTRLYQLADDSMTGRRVGELGNFKGTTWIASEFKRLGLKPAGENGTWFQDLPYGPTSFDLASTRLTAGSTALKPESEFVPMTPSATNGLAAKVDLHGVPVVFAGRFGDTTVQLDPNRFRGKVAVFLAPERPAASGAGFGGISPESCPADEGWPNQRGAAYALAQQKAAAAARGNTAARRPFTGTGRGGALRDNRIGTLELAGYILVDDSIPEAAARAAFTGRSGMKPANPIAYTGVLGAAVSAAGAEKLFGKPVSQLAIGAEGQSLSASWSYEWRMAKWPGRNVIAILPGSDPARAGEYVLLGAHNDHDGVLATAVDHDSLRAWNTIMRPQGANDRPTCRPNAVQQHLIDSMIAHARSIRRPIRDSIMNGANDDGSGTVVLLEVAEKFARERPARSVIFISHVGEEAGLLGSAWFTSHPTVALDSVVAAINMDMVGGGRTTDVAMGGPNAIQSLGSRRLASEFGDVIDSVNALRTSPMAIDRTWDVFENPLNRFCRSDQVNYVKHNVPVTYFSTGYYRDYHQLTDEPRYIAYDHMSRLANFVHDVMKALADRRDKPAIDGPNPNYPKCG